MGKLYQSWDFNLINYEMYRFQEFELRGPKSNSKDFISYIGSAHTFGRYCKYPLPNLVGKALNIGTLNFGIGGKGPTYFLKQRKIIDAVNESKLVVVQVMSARSISNSVFQATDGGRDGVRIIDRRMMTSDDVFECLISGRDERGLDKSFMESLVEETRQNYVSEMIDLLNAIKPPKILFWFSVRSPLRKQVHPYILNPHAFISIVKQVGVNMGIIRGIKHRYLCFTGEFPHLVNSEMIDKIRPYSDYYLECVTNVGLPQILANLRRGTTVWNNYYPSPEMHRQAAKTLEPICKWILNQHKYN